MYLKGIKHSGITGSLAQQWCENLICLIGCQSINILLLRAKHHALYKEFLLGPEEF